MKNPNLFAEIQKLLENEGKPLYLVAELLNSLIFDELQKEFAKFTELCNENLWECVNEIATGNLQVDPNLKTLANLSERTLRLMHEIDHFLIADSLQNQS